ncbi:hypothetical protein M2101_001402 [Parabacteroides sp. PM5-20]|nr:hypothetical protein [Parabacteroides sp. PM5-20]
MQWAGLKKRRGETGEISNGYRIYTSAKVRPFAFHPKARIVCIYGRSSDLFQIECLPGGCPLAKQGRIGTHSQREMGVVPVAILFNLLYETYSYGDSPGLSPGSLFIRSIGTVS